MDFKQADQVWYFEYYGSIDDNTALYLGDLYLSSGKVAKFYHDLQEIELTNGDRNWRCYEPENLFKSRDEAINAMTDRIKQLMENNNGR